MRQPKIAAVFLTSLFAMVTSSAAMCQDLPVKSNQTEGKKAEENKAADKTVDVHVKVSVKGNGGVPPDTMVEISGEEKACGNLSSADARKTIRNGEAVFTGLPVCNVRIKLNVQLYMPVSTPFNLSKYDSPISIVLEREQ